MIRELQRPRGTVGDENATEVVRVWIANGELCVSMFMGMWEGADDCDEDEAEVWGRLLADLTRHIANGMMQEYGWGYDTTRQKIKQAFLRDFDDKSQTVQGGFDED